MWILFFGHIALLCLTSIIHHPPVGSQSMFLLGRKSIVTPLWLLCWDGASMWEVTPLVWGRRSPLVSSKWKYSSTSLLLVWTKPLCPKELSLIYCVMFFVTLHLVSSAMVGGLCKMITRSRLRLNRTDALFSLIVPVVWKRAYSHHRGISVCGAANPMSAFCSVFSFIFSQRNIVSFLKSTWINEHRIRVDGFLLFCVFWCDQVIVVLPFM